MQWSGNTRTASQNPGGGQSEGYVSVSVAGGVDVNLGFNTYKNRIIEVTGVITASFNVILPLSPQGAPWVIKNSTSGNFQLTFKGTSGNGVIVAQGKTAVIWTDGTHFYPWPNDADAQGFLPNNQNIIAMTDANYTATFADMLCRNIQVNGTLTAGRNFVVPATFKEFTFFNNTAQTVTPKTPSGTGIGVAAGKRQLLQCDGTNVVALAAAI